jgi:ATP-dependent protease ClpP protease subunit
MSDKDREGIPEIALVGELSDRAGELAEKLLSIPPGSECIVYFDSPGGNPYCGLSLASMIRLRGLAATAVVTGECSSAALWPFAACRRRLVTEFSVFLFHPMKWQSEEHVQLAEAAEWARHFGQLERQMDHLLAQLFGVGLDRIERWLRPGRYVGGVELVEQGLAERVDLNSPIRFFANGAALSGGRVKRPRRRPSVPLV